MSEISPEDLRKLLLENASLAERLEEAEARTHALEEKPGHPEAAAARPQEPTQAPAFSPEETAALVMRLLDSVDSQLKGMTVRDAELHLNVALERTGGKEGFVIPTADSPPEVRENLQSISLRLSPRID